MDFRILTQELFVRIKNDGRNAEPVRFCTESLTLARADGLANDHGTHVLLVQNCESGINRGGWNNCVSCMGKDSIANWG